MPSRATKFFRARNFSKGLVLERPALSLEEGEAQEATNVELDSGLIRRRDGWKKTHTAALPSGDDAVRSLFSYYPDTGAPVLYAVGGTHFMKAPAGGDFVTLTPTLAPSSPVYATFKATQNKIYIATKYGADGTTQGIKRLDPATDTLVDVAGTPAIAYIAQFADSLFGAGDSSNPSRVYWSRFFPNQDIKTDSSSGWPTANFTDVTPGDGDRIMGFGRLLNALIVFKERSIHRITGTPPDDANVEAGDLAVFSYEEQGGCVAPRSIASSQNLVVYLNRNGIFGYDGVSPRELSAPIRPLFETLNESQLKDAVGVFLTPYHYVLSVTREDSQVPDLVISMHLRPQSFTVWEGLEVYSLGTFRFDGDTVPIIGSRAAVGRMDADKDGMDSDGLTGGKLVDWSYVTGILNMGKDPYSRTIRRGWSWAKISNGSYYVEMLPDFATEGPKKLVELGAQSAKGQTAKRVPLPAYGTARHWALKVAGNSAGPSPEVQEVALEFFPSNRSAGV